MQEYRIIEAHDAVQLALAVNGAIAEYWTPIGGVGVLAGESGPTGAIGVSTLGTETKLLQAMTRDKPRGAVSGPGGARQR